MWKLPQLKPQRRRWALKAAPTLRFPSQTQRPTRWNLSCPDPAQATFSSMCITKREPTLTLDVEMVGSSSLLSISQ